MNEQVTRCDPELLVEAGNHLLRAADILKSAALDEGERAFSKKLWSTSKRVEKLAMEVVGKHTSVRCVLVNP